jgi:DNA-binding transcriptional regulator YhcF (GntR family)
MYAAVLLPRLAERLREAGAGPVSRLVVDEIWLAVVEGTLDVGQRLPTTRELAIGLGISPRHIERAYDELERRGVIVTRPGAGTFVSLVPPSEEEHAHHQQFAELCNATVRRAAELGYDVGDLIDALAELRTPERSLPTEEPQS